MTQPSLSTVPAPAESGTPKTEPHEAAAEEGLRARKRAATLARIEKAALELATEHGYEAVTVDMVCDEAMISPRTFFNYFGSKEGAFLGATPPLPSDAEIAAFVEASGTDILGDFIELLALSLIGHEPDSELLRSRRSLIQATPELAKSELARMGEMYEQLVSVILRRFARQGRTPETVPDLADEARMVVALSGGVMHHAMRAWFENNTRATAYELLQQSLALVRRITSPSDPG